MKSLSKEDYMKNVIYMTLLFTSIFLAGCSSQSEEKTYEELNNDVLQLLIDEDFQEVHEFFNEDLQQDMTVIQLEEIWHEQIKEAGDFLAIDDAAKTEGTDSHTTLETPIEFTNVVFDARIIYDEEKKIVSLHFTKGYANAQLPENVVEEEVTIGEGTDYPLGATLTLPKNHEDPLPAVILVHGSGPSDRDETAFGYKPFRDIAWELAERGIASLRYDKRTFVHGEKMSSEFSTELTVHEETVEDAVRGAKLLKADPRIDEKNVYLIGHSLGGMLAPRIDQEGGDFAGIIILAGSLRPLWEIVYDQNIAFIETENMSEEQRKEALTFIEEEFEKGKNLLNMTEEEAKDETIFGFPAYYFYDMDKYNTEEVVKHSKKPIFVLQGEDDFQVYYEKDFQLWEEMLREKNNATLKSYPGLNHFFIAYEGEDKKTVKEYEYPARVETQVIEDMANWIHDVANDG